MDLTKFTPIQQEFIKAPDKAVFITNLKYKLSITTNIEEAKELKSSIKQFKTVYSKVRKEVKEATRRVSRFDRFLDIVTDFLYIPIDYMIKVATKGLLGVSIFIVSSLLLWLGITYLLLLQQGSLGLAGVRDVSGVVLISLLLLGIDVIRGRKKFM